MADQLAEFLASTKPTTYRDALNRWIYQRRAVEKAFFATPIGAAVLEYINVRNAEESIEATLAADGFVSDKRLKALKERHDAAWDGLLTVLGVELPPRPRKEDFDDRRPRETTGAANG